jgi:hypothetical protein
MEPEFRSSLVKTFAPTISSKNSSITGMGNLFLIVCTLSFLYNNNNNNNQAFYSQASWGRLEMKPHEQKKGRYKTRAKKKGKTKGDKKIKSKKEKRQ